MYQAFAANANASTNSANEDSTMNQAMQTFDFHGANIRVVEHEGEAWFVAKDVATLLGYQRPPNAVSSHCKAGKSLIDLGVPKSGTLDPQTVVIPERDVYRLVMKSKLPEAERFEEWVVGEVLPTIRKTGGYQMEPNLPQDYASALRALLAEVEANEAAQKHIEMQSDIMGDMIEDLEAKEKLISRTLEWVTVQRFIGLCDIYIEWQDKQALGFAARKLSIERGVEISKSPRKMKKGGKLVDTSPNIYREDIIHEAAVNLGLISPDKSIW